MRARPDQNDDYNNVIETEDDDTHHANTGFPTRLSNLQLMMLGMLAIAAGYNIEQERILYQQDRDALLSRQRQENIFFMSGLDAYQQILDENEAFTQTIAASLPDSPMKRNHQPPTFVNQNKLDALQIQQSFIPDDFICPITCNVIDGIPVYDDRAPHRYSKHGIETSLSYKNQNPITRQSLNLNDLKEDYFLKIKIDLFIKVMEKHQKEILVINSKDKNEREKLFATLLEDVELRFQKIMCPPTIAMTNRQRFFMLHASSFEKYFNRLGLQSNATDNEVITAYRKLAIKMHPDKDKSSGAHDRFTTLTQAKEILLSRNKNHDQQSSAENVNSPLKITY